METAQEEAKSKESEHSTEAEAELDTGTNEARSISERDAGEIRSNPQTDVGETHTIAQPEGNDTQLSTQSNVDVLQPLPQLEGAEIQTLPQPPPEAPLAAPAERLRNSGDIQVPELNIDGEPLEELFKAAGDGNYGEADKQLDNKAVIKKKKKGKAGKKGLRPKVRKGGKKKVKKRVKKDKKKGVRKGKGKKKIRKGKISTAATETSNQGPLLSAEMATTPVGSEHGSVPGVSLAIPGVARVTLTAETQQILGCVVGKDVTIESPWLIIDKTLIDDNIDLHSESSDFLPIKEDIGELKTPTVLVGYDAVADVDNQFYVCVTETARKAVLETIEQMRDDQEKWLLNALEKPARAWESLGSEKEVDLFTVKSGRSLVQMQVETTLSDISSACNFTNREVEDVPDGYFQFPHRDDVPEHISRLRVDEAVQVSLPKIDTEAQTDPGIPDNSWTQYEYTVDTDKPIEDEVVEKALAQFLQGVHQEICDALHYNEIMDLHRDDYGRLVRYEEDTEIPQAIQYNEFMSFTDMKHCQGKLVSCAAFHPMWSGVVALAYVDHSRKEIGDSAQEIDDITHGVYTLHPVLIWSFVDAFKPKLILDCPREVQVLQFCPHNENILVGGLSNGQLIMWDIEGKIEKVEQETKMTPDQVKYNLAMNALMDWMKPTLRMDYIQPTAVSAIDGSHTDMITDINWIAPSWEMTSSGQFVACSEDHESLQVVTCSLDGTIMFWNLNPGTGGLSGVPRRKKIMHRPDGLKIERSPYHDLNRKLKPTFILEVMNDEEKKLFMLSSLSIYTQPMSYTEDEEANANLTPARRESMSTRFKFKPVYSPNEDNEQKNRILAGSVNGTVVAIEWQGTENNVTDFIHAKTCSVTNNSPVHSSHVFVTRRNPFIKHLLVTVGSRKFAVWSEKLGKKPLLWRYTRQQGYSHVAWSLQRPSMLQLTRNDGTIEVWDLLIRSDACILAQSISGKLLTGIDGHMQYLPNNVVGISDYNGSFRLFFIPSQYQESDVAADIGQLEKMVEREQIRREAMSAWEKRWEEKNSAEAKRLRERKEEENRKRAEEQQAERERLEEKQRREEMEMTEIQKKKEPPIHVAKLVAMEQRWQDTRRAHMVRMLLDKKKMEKSDLERRRGPFIAAQEAHQLKTLKLRQIMRQRNSIFKNTVTMLFPEIIPEPPKEQSNSEILAAQLEEMDETFVQRYYEIEKLALAQLQATSLEQTFNWKRTMQEARLRREVLDTALYHQTSRLERAEQRREYRRLHRNSEMQREDEKKNIKSRSKVGFVGSSLSVLDEFSGGGIDDGLSGSLNNSKNSMMVGSKE